MILVSACLLGIKCRYDGKSCPDEILLAKASKGIFIPVCPEQLGGLATPRLPAEIDSGHGLDVLEKQAKVFNVKGTDVTWQFVRGAHEALILARLMGIRTAVLKEKSPSCGVLCIKRSGQNINGMGVTTALLTQYGIRVISSERINEDDF